jgi:hypothetical protein
MKIPSRLKGFPIFYRKNPLLLFFMGGLMRVVSEFSNRESFDGNWSVHIGLAQEPG